MLIPPTPTAETAAIHLLRTSLPAGERRQQRKQMGDRTEGEREREREAARGATRPSKRQPPVGRHRLPERLVDGGSSMAGAAQ